MRMGRAAASRRRAIGGGGGGGPVPNPVAWWDASDAASLFQDNARTIATGAIGNPVGGWADKSPDGRHLLETTAGQSPTLQQFGGANEVRFDGVDDGLRTVVGQTWPATTDLFFVMRNPADNQFVTAFESSGGSAIIGVVQSGSAAANNLTVGTPSNQINGIPVSPDTRGGLYLALGANRAIFACLGAAMNFGSFKLGNYGSYEFAGGISEIRIYPALSGFHRDSVLAELRAKWGL